MSGERKLHHTGWGATPYKWFYALGSYMVVFPHLDQFWHRWWRFDTEAAAICAVQYLSCLLYEKDKNPVFAPWTPDAGGGPPSLWEVDAHIFDQGTLPENVQFLEATLDVSYVKDKLVTARTMIKNLAERRVLDGMIHDFDAQLSVLESRLLALPRLLAEPKQHVLDWDDAL